MDLNNDVITKILLLLPMQSVLRFRSLCKSWCNIIDSSTFRESHHQSKNNVNEEDETLNLQFTNTCYNTYYTWEVSTQNTVNGKYRKSFPAITEFLNDKGWEEFFVAGPLNGLICMYNTTPYSEVNTWGPSIAIYNPCLDKIKILPVSPVSSSLTNESSEFKWVLGFGFDYVAKGYKVVQLTSFSDGRRTRVEVCSGTTNTWRELAIDGTTLDDELFLYNIETIKSSAHVNSGSWAHFKTQRRAEGIYHGVYVILSFDMQNEVFETIYYPVLEDRYLCLGSYGVFAKDDDSFTLLFPSSDYLRLEVWELESRNKERGWNHVRDVNVVAFTHEVPFTHVEILPRVRALWKRDGIVLVEYILGWEREYWIFFTEYIPGKRNLIFYDYSTEKVIKCCEMPIGGGIIRVQGQPYFTIASRELLCYISCYH